MKLRVLIVIMMVLAAASCSKSSGASKNSSTADTAATTSTLSSLAFVMPGGFAEGACSGAVTIKALNAAQQTFTVPDDLAVTVSGQSSTTTFYADNQCATPITDLSTLKIAANSSSLTLYLVDSAAESIYLACMATGAAAGYGTVTASDTVAESAGASAGTLRIEIHANTLDKLPTAGCFALPFYAVDERGNPPSQAVTLTLSATPAATVKFYSDPSCAEALVSFTIPANDYASYPIYVKDTINETVALTATIAGEATGSTTQTLPQQLMFYTGD